jgi:hypothetical protein
MNFFLNFSDQLENSKSLRFFINALKWCILILAAFAITGLSRFSMAGEKETGQDKSKEVIRMADTGEDNESGEKTDQNKIDRRQDQKGEESKQEQTGDKKIEDMPSDEGKEEDLVEVGGKKGPRFKFKGQVKNLDTFHRTDNYLGENPLFTGSKNLSADLTRVRLSPEFLYKDILTLKVDYDNELIWSNYGKSADFKNSWRPSQYNDLLHLAWEPYRGRDLYYRTKLHRAYAKVSVDKLSLTAGRQQIRYGSGKLWNPLDILNPIFPTFIEGIEEQKGSDALKMDIYPDEKTELSIVFNPKKSNDKITRFNFQDCNYLLHAKTSISDVDIAVLGGYLSRRGLAGFDFAAILFKGMLRGSLIVSQAPKDYKSPYLTIGWTNYYPDFDLRKFIPGKNEKQSVHFSANVGYEYNFKEGIYFLVEYFYNQNASNYNKDLKAALYTAQFNAMNQKTYLQLANQFLTVNQHYIGTALGYDFHPLVRGELFLIGDIQGQGIFWGPTIKVNAYENLDFTVGMMGAFVFNKKTSDFSEFRKNYLFYVSGSYVF